jgi:hypothetical protein
LPYYFQSFGNAYNQTCEQNPYVYSEFPREWLTWEKIHWDVSCFQRQNSMIQPYSFNGGYIDQRIIRTEQSFGESNPFMRFY